MGRKPSPMEERIARLEARMKEQDQKLAVALETVVRLRTSIEASTMRRRTGDLERARTADLVPADSPTPLPYVVEPEPVVDGDAETEVMLPPEEK